jgi:shikimate dehydrogenase
MTLSGAARLAGVIGWPVAHSLSPRLHGFWLDTHCIDGAYVPLAVRPYALAAAITGLKEAGFRGVNVTIPHKIAAFALADRCDDAARKLGAVNLLLFDGKGIEARNTDGEGLAASLVEMLGADGLADARVVVLGAGGAARAAVLACAQLRAKEVLILNRSVGRAELLVKELGSLRETDLAGAALDQWPNVARTTRLVINATSAGMKGTSETARDSPLVDIAALPRGSAVCDLVYNPLETPLLAAARAVGLVAIDGLGMLMHQAVPSFEAFFGKQPVVTQALRAQLESALRHAG